jgi:hypothetical protein
MKKLNIWDRNFGNRQENSQKPQQNQNIDQTQPSNPQYAQRRVSKITQRYPDPPLKISSPLQNPQPSAEESVKTRLEEIPTVKRYKVLGKKQRRRQAMSVSVSEQEEEMLREGAALEGMTFSSWARKHLFRAMRQKIPKRPNS